MRRCYQNTTSCSRRYALSEVDGTSFCILRVLSKEKSPNNQSSVICLSKKRFDSKEVVEVTGSFYAEYKGQMGINPGDLTAMKAAGFLFVSFHGDTGGMATADVLETVC